MFISLLLRKTLYDLVDNFFWLLLGNGVIMIVATAMGIGAYNLYQQAPAPALVLGLFTWLLVAVFFALSVFRISGILPTGRPELQDKKQLGQLLKLATPYGLVFFLLWLIPPALIFALVQGQELLDPTVNFALIIIMGWVLLFWTLSFQYFFPLALELEDSPGMLIKKSIFVLIDNPLSSLLTVLLSLVLLLLSSISGFLLFGPMGVLVMGVNGGRFMMIKYAYLKHHPEAIQKVPSWSLLLADESERVGKRDLKELFLPWKRKP